MKTYTVVVDAEEYQVSTENGSVIAVNGERCVPVTAEQTARHQYSVLLDGTAVAIAASGTAGTWEMFSEASLHRVQVTSERERLHRQLSAAVQGPVRTEVRAPMPALVVRVEVKVGDSVSAGQGLVILEAMKMENEIKAHTPGKVKEICVAAGEAVEKDEILILLE